MERKENTGLIQQGIPVVELASGEHSPARTIGAKVLELGIEITTNEFTELYLVAHGYSGEQSRELQAVSRDEVKRRQDSAQDKLLSKNLPQAVAVAIESNNLPNPWLQSDNGDEAVPAPKLTKTQSELLGLIVTGLQRAEIAETLNSASTNTQYVRLFKAVGAHSSSQAVWQAYKFGLFKAGVGATEDSASKSARRVEILEEQIGQKILPQAGLSVSEKRDKGYKRYEEFILALLDEPGFTMEHPRVGAYVRDTYGYSLGQWRSIISKLGYVYGVIEIGLPEANGKTANAANRISLVEGGLLANRERPFVTDQVLETYQKRLNGEGPEPELATEFPGFELNEEELAALPPALRVSMCINLPAGEYRRFTGMTALIRCYSLICGISPLDLVPTIYALKQKKWLDLAIDERSEHFLQLTPKGARLLPLGVKKVKEEVKNSRINARLEGSSARQQR